MLEEDEVFQPNPDDEQENESHNTSTGTPRRPAKSQKRKRPTAETVNSSSSAKRQRTKALNKKERLEILKHMKRASILPVLKTLFLERNDVVFDKLLSNRDILTELIGFHQDTFVSLYEANGIGKDKYMSFQFLWHKYCSIFLLPNNTQIQLIFSPPTQKMDHVYRLWLAFCEGDAHHNYKNFMIQFSSSIYEILLQEVHGAVTTVTNCNNAEAFGSESLSVEQDDVYFRFGGATIASMLHNRYDDIRKCTIEDKREIMSLEIAILHGINTKNKESMPLYLKYRDRGFMYSPDPSFLPFLRAVDDCIKIVVNDKGIKEHGDQLIKVAHILASESTHLQSTFFKIIEEKIPMETVMMKEAALTVYKEMVRKLCNTRIQEFLSAFQQKIVSGKGHAALEGQNLRDSLLSQHLNVQSRVNLQ